MDIENRLRTYKSTSEYIKRLDDREIEELLQKAVPIGRGIGGQVSSLLVGDVKVFVKRIHLADIEQRKENHRTTRNYFNLPLYYQYGIGSAGFGSWRELLAHEMATEWVLEKTNFNFPILFHSRVLSRVKREPLALSNFKTLDEYVSSLWNDSSAVRDRMLAIDDATADVVLFLELFPKTLAQWITSLRESGIGAFLSALPGIEQALFSTSKFMRENGMIHFDGHPQNILCDGDQLYFSDFGLAASLQFSISPEEVEFLRLHRNYDIGFSSLILVAETLRFFVGDDRNQISLLIRRACNGDRLEMLPSEANVIVARYSWPARVMDEFFGGILKNRMTQFPSLALDTACEHAGLSSENK